MKLYHGSNMSIDKIDLTKGRVGKDFGQGFYLSANKSQAQQMAEITTFKMATGNPTITTFEIDESIFKANDLRIKHFEGYTEEWAKFIVKNRQNNTRQQVHDYDIVIGPIADDKVGVQIRLFTEKYINVKELVNRLTFVKPTIQYFFATEKSINYLHRV